MKNESKLPLVSIIIPVYNGSNFVRDAIDSALAQTYKNIEIIVINDGSKDNTEEILKSYGKKIIYITQENGGVASALNLAIKKSKGEYISWLSHDDLYEKEKVEREVLCAIGDGNSRKEIVFCNFIFRNMFTKKDEKVQNSLNELVRSNQKNSTFQTLLALYKSSINGCSLLIPKKAFNECGLFDDRYKTTQDYQLWFKMYRKGYRFTYLPEYLVISRQHDQQDTRSKLDLHYRELNPLYIGAYDLFKDEFGKMSFSDICIFLDVLKERKLDSAYRHMLFSWANYLNKKNDLPHIWLYWESPKGAQIPDYIRLCWKSIILKNRGKFEITCLDQYSVKKVLNNLDLNYMLFDEIAHKADYIRFKLLEKYGGIWLDSDFICFKSLTPLLKTLNKYQTICTAFWDKSKKTKFPLIFLFAANKQNSEIKRIVNSIEEYISTKLIIGIQPLWDEIGGHLIQRSNVNIHYIDAQTSFSPIKVWNPEFEKLYTQNGHNAIKLMKEAYGQMLSSSNFSYNSNISTLSEDNLLESDTLIGEWWRLILDIKKSKLKPYNNNQPSMKEKQFLEQIYVKPVIGHLLVRGYLRTKKIIFWLKSL